MRHLVEVQGRLAEFEPVLMEIASVSRGPISNEMPLTTVIQA